MSDAHTRRKRIEAIRSNAHAAQLRLLQVVLRKLRRAVRDDKPVAILPTEAQLILFATKRKSAPGAGAPEILAEFHRWMAIDALWERNGGAVLAKVANRDVADRWEVSLAMVETALREHRDSAEKFLDAGGNDRRAMGSSIAIIADAFRALSVEHPAMKPRSAPKVVRIALSGGVE